MAFGGTIKLSGESEYKKALTEITGNLKVLSSEMTLATSQFNKNETTTQSLTSKNKVLTEQIEEQKKKVDVLKQALEASKTATGENGASTQKWQIELNKAEAQLNTMNKQLDTNMSQLNMAEEATRKGYKTVEEYSDAQEEAGNSTIKFGDIIKANLISDAIVGGIKALASAVSGVADSMKSALTDGAAYADNILTLSTQTGLSTESLQKYNAVAELVDVSTETMTKSMAKNIKSMTTAAKGTGDMADAYKKLGVNVKNSDGSLRDSETVYWETIDALKNVKDETERDSLAMTILGKSAQELNPLIQQGSQGIKDLGDEAWRMGNVLSEDALNALGELDDQMQIFKSTTSATGNILAGAFAPAVSSLIGDINDLGAGFNYLISSIVSGDEGGIEIASNMLAESVSMMVENISEQIPKILDIASSLIETLIEVIADNLPTLIEGGISILTSLLDGIVKSLPTILPVVVQAIMTIVQGIVENLPTILQAGITVITELISGIAQALPELIPAIVDAVVLMTETLIDNIDLIIDAGIEIIFGLIDGIIEALPRLIDKIPEIIDKLINAIVNNLPKLIEAGITLTIKLAEGLIKAIPQLVSKLPQIITSIVSGLGKGLGKMAEIGLNLVKGLWNGISNAVSWILDKIKGFCSSIVNGIKSFFGIHSPSTLFKDEIGKNLALGVGEGFADEMTDVTKEMTASIPTEFDTSINGNIGSSISGTTLGIANCRNELIYAFREALKDVKVVMNDREMGTFIIDTVERVVYT